MDLHRHLQVLWRSKSIIAVGLLLGIVLAILSTFNVKFSGGPSLSYRGTETWTSTTKIMITQAGFPWGRTLLPGSDPEETAEGEPVPVDPSDPQFADPGRLAQLAWMYSHFLMGDQIRVMLGKPVEGQDLQAYPATAGGTFSAAALPIIELQASATSAADAQRLAVTAPNALEQYLTQQQDEGDVPKGQRVEAVVVNKSQAAVLVKGHALTMGLVILMLAIGAAVALAYVLENLRLSRAQRTASSGSTGPVEVLTPLPTPEARRAGESAHEALHEAMGSPGGWADNPSVDAGQRLRSGAR